MDKTLLSNLMSNSLPVVDLVRIKNTNNHIVQYLVKIQLDRVFGYIEAFVHSEEAEDTLVILTEEIEFFISQTNRFLHSYSYDFGDFEEQLRLKVLFKEQASVWFNTQLKEIAEKHFMSDILFKDFLLNLDSVDLSSTYSLKDFS